MGDDLSIEQDTCDTCDTCHKREDHEDSFYWDFQGHPKYHVGDRTGKCGGKLTDKISTGLIVCAECKAAWRSEVLYFRGQVLAKGRVPTKPLPRAVAAPALEQGYGFTHHLEDRSELMSFDAMLKTTYTKERVENLSPDALRDINPRYIEQSRRIWEADPWSWGMRLPVRDPLSSP